VLLPGKSEMKNVPFMTYKTSMAYHDGKERNVSEAIFKISLRSDVPDEGDFILLMNKMKVYYNIEKEFNLKQLDETLAKKMLYVDNSITEMRSKDFKEAYSFPFEYKQAVEVREKAKQGAKDALYFKADVYNGIINMMIIDAETGAILSRSLMNGFNKPASKNNFSSESEINNSGGNFVYKVCSDCALQAGDILKTYNDNVKVKKSVLKDLADEKKQIKYSDPLIIY